MLSRGLGIDLWVKRDDLTGIAGGGSKERKASAILADRPADTTWLVTNGGVQSNHARTLAIHAARLGLGFTCVLHGLSEDDPAVGGNYCLIRLLSSDVRLVEHEQIAAEIQRVVAELSSRQERALVIPGGGHSRAGILGMATAVPEVARQMVEEGVWPDVVVHASGTGGTQAGLVAGFAEFQSPPNVVGISIARTRLRGEPAVSEALGWVGCDSDHWSFDDRFIGGGYAVPSEAGAEAISLAAKLDGLILDPTYTGKAMAGLIRRVRSGEIPRGSTVLFWHTGGLLNLTG